MKITLLAIGKRMPAWVNDAFKLYQQRMPKECSLELIELDMPKRTKNSVTDVLIQKESQLILTKIPKQSYVIALDERGAMWSTYDLAKNLSDWMSSGINITVIIGGPDGLSNEIKQKADKQWSLSRLTLPHPMIRPLVAEQFYRAWSIIANHPYHRE